MKPGGPCCLLCRSPVLVGGGAGGAGAGWGAVTRRFITEPGRLSVTRSGLQSLLSLATGEIPSYQVGKCTGYPLPTKKEKKKRENPGRVEFNLTKAVTGMIWKEHPSHINCLLGCNTPEIVIIIEHKEKSCVSIYGRFIKAQQTSYLSENE